MLLSALPFFDDILYIICINVPVLFRIRMSLNDPNTVYYDERRRSRNMKDLNAEELFATEAKQIGYYNEKSKKYLDILIDESNLYKPNHETAVSPSCLRMLVAHRKIHAQWPVTALLPRGCYLHESLAVDQKFTQTWKQPILDKLLDPNCMEHLTFVSFFSGGRGGGKVTDFRLKDGA